MAYLHVADDSRAAVLRDVADERLFQLGKWGVQLHPSGTGGPEAARVARLLKELCQSSGLEDGAGDTWLKILAEEVGEAADEVDPAPLRRELVQCAAVLVAWIETLDRAEEAVA
ncbi:MAG: hypothetical protein IPK85_02920 [Gemmatimonadetes bacterium]|nr:hypothetical protein [Gemmatimonadota bacterium]